MSKTAEDEDFSDDEHEITLDDLAYCDRLSAVAT
jgi:hypothetical protein